ncbi:cytochrome b/b6 domain-containing protein [Thiohalorhabdus denitrificans]|uniref:Ni/Fe-hydrogenase 1 B-type cytochrome subunit n=1 Tax=Thiohalorhabdus denitrificans TaxID=381306 RepID=A0A1G5DG82_9GAMM|nr:cytochrome b/b6 domain-containing protein [Thiohalorhabdus denitrificans]SCY13390.1 Ni/Fe-hydrogenase 1 B-type cytochrome subunit [Thiohalorhabdus denitrificans]
MEDTPLYGRRVWDPVLRILHWWIAIAVLIQFALGGVILAEDSLGLSEGGEESLVTIHATVGYIFGAGLLARILWLFLAPGSGSWRDVLPHTAAQWGAVTATARHYLRGFRGTAPFYRAHNPLAGLAYAAFLVVGISQVVTGATMFTSSVELGEAWEEIHEIGFWIILAFVILHLAMVALHELTEGRSLVSAMIHGRKHFTAEELEQHPEAQQEEEIR